MRFIYYNVLHAEILCILMYFVRNDEQNMCNQLICVDAALICVNA